MDKLNSDYQRSELDHEREKHFNRDNQLREQRLQEDLRLTKARIVGVHLLPGGQMSIYRKPLRPIIAADDIHLFTVSRSMLMDHSIGAECLHFGTH